MPKVTAPSFLEGPQPVPDVPIVGSMSIFDMPRLEAPSIPQSDRLVPGKLAFTHTVPVWEAPKPSQLSTDILKMPKLEAPHVEHFERVVPEELPSNHSETIWEAPQLFDEPSIPTIDIPKIDQVERLLPDFNVVDSPKVESFDKMVSELFESELTVEGPDDSSLRVERPLNSPHWETLYSMHKSDRVEQAQDVNPQFEIREETKKLINKYVKVYQPKVKYDEPKVEEYAEIITLEPVRQPVEIPTVDPLLRREAIADVNQAVRVLEIAKQVSENDEEAEELVLSSLNETLVRKGVAHTFVAPAESEEEEEDKQIETQVKVKTRPKTAEAGKRVPPKVEAKPKADEEEPEEEEEQERVLREVETIIFERDEKADKKRREAALSAAKKAFETAQTQGVQNISGWEIAKRMPPIAPQDPPVKSELVKKNPFSLDGSYSELVLLLAQEGPLYSKKDTEETVEKRIRKAPAVRVSKTQTTEKVTEKDVRRVLNLKSLLEV